MALVSTGAAAADPKADKVVCKRVHTDDTGSHFRSSKKVCAKKSEWKEAEDETERGLRNSASRAAANPTPQGMGASPQ